MKSIAEAEGFEVEFKPLGFNAAVQALESGQVDAVMAGMGITDERKQKFDFTNSYYDSGIGMGVPKNSEITSLSDLKGKKVAVKLGTQGATYAESIKSKYGFTITTFEDSSSMYQDVMVGNSDALFEDYPVLAYSITSNNLPLKMTDHNENKTEYGVAVNKGENAELITAFNNGLKKLKESGKYDEIINNTQQMLAKHRSNKHSRVNQNKLENSCDWFMEHNRINSCCFNLRKFNRYYLRFNEN